MLAVRTRACMLHACLLAHLQLRDDLDGAALRQAGAARVRHAAHAARAAATADALGAAAQQGPARPGQPQRLPPCALLFELCPLERGHRRLPLQQQLVHATVLDHRDSAVKLVREQALERGRHDVVGFPPREVEELLCPDRPLDAAPAVFHVRRGQQKAVAVAHWTEEGVVGRPQLPDQGVIVNGGCDGGCFRAAGRPALARQQHGPVSTCCRCCSGGWALLV